MCRHVFWHNLLPFNECKWFIVNLTITLFTAIPFRIARLINDPIWLLKPSFSSLVVTLYAARTCLDLQCWLQPKSNDRACKKEEPASRFSDIYCTFLESQCFAVKLIDLGRECQSITSDIFNGVLRHHSLSSASCCYLGACPSAVEFTECFVCCQVFVSGKCQNKAACRA